jgi:putative membrane protein
MITAKGSWSPPLNTNYNMMNNYGGYEGYNMVFGGWIGWIFIVLWWAIIIIALVSLVRWAVKFKKYHGHEKSPMEIIKERYAQGEITKEEFESMKKDLQ